MKCLKCNSEVKDGMKFCPQCGTEMPTIHFCSQCGVELKDGMKFCPQCGSSIEESNHGKSVINDNSIKRDEILYSNPYALNNNGDDITIIHKEQSRIKNWLKKAAIIFACYIGLSVIVNMCSDKDNSDTSESSVQQLNNNEAEHKEIPSWLYGKWLLRSSHPSIGEFQVAIMILEDGRFAETYQSHSMTDSKSGYITDVFDNEIRVKFTLGSSDSQCYPINNSSQKIGYGQGLWLNKY